MIVSSLDRFIPTSSYLLRGVFRVGVMNIVSGGGDVHLAVAVSHPPCVHSCWHGINHVLGLGWLITVVSVI